jgi:ParB family transcriptional regulator, chromosome partitioning protein
MRSTTQVNPFRVRLWRHHDRLEEYISETTCREEIESFQKHGQIVPALGRRLRSDPEFDIELIYGARRLFVARHINVPLLVELCELSDQEAIVAMDVENRQRRDISPYERGLAYTRWLRTGLFKSQDDIARALNVSASQISRLLKVARLPAVVVSAFESAADIREEWGSHLMDTLDDPGMRPVVVDKAREIHRTKPRPSAAEAYRELIATSIAGRKVKALMRDHIVKGQDGLPLFRVGQRRDGYILLLPRRRISGKRLDDIQSAVASILDNPG